LDTSDSCNAAQQIIEAFLRRDYYLADSIVDKTEDIRSLENEIILFLDKEKTSFSTQHECTNVYIKLILEDIRRTVEHASDIATSYERNGE
jgi:hypothetical protein